MPETTKEQDEFRERVMKLRQTDLGIAFYLYSELLRNATEVEMRTYQGHPDRKEAFRRYNEALHQILEILFDIENI